MYDVRKHGESESGRGLVSFGPLEKRDFVGAVLYLRSRPDVDGQRIGSLGVSMGGTIALYGAPDCQPIKAILALQPAKVTTFNANFCRLEFGPAGPLVMMPPIELIYRAWRVTPPSKQDPGAPARLARRHGRQYVQGTGDRYGTMEDVEAFAAGDADRRRAGRPLPVDRPLRRLSLRLRVPRRDRGLLHSPRLGAGICERRRASNAASGSSLRVVMNSPAEGATR